MLHCSEVWGLAENGWGSRRRCPAVAAPCWALMARGAAGYWRELFAVTGCRDEDGRAQRRGREAGNDVAAGRRSCRAGSLLDSARKWRCTGGFGSNVLLPVMANVGSAPLLQWEDEAQWPVSVQEGQDQRQKGGRQGIGAGGSPAGSAAMCSRAGRTCRLKKAMEKSRGVSLAN